MSARLGFTSGAAIGTLGGLMGLGGAEFRLPVLVGLLGWAPRAAVPLNLMVSFVVLVAALPARMLTVQWAELARYQTEMAALSLGAIGAAFLGAGLLRHLRDATLAKAILVLLVALGLVMIGDAFLSGHEGLAPASMVARAAIGVACGVVIGLVSSLLGVAGGELIIPTLVLGFGVPMKAAGSMSMLIGMVTIAAGLARHVGAADGPLRSGPAWRGTIAPMGAGSILGAVAGGLMVGLVPAAALKVSLGGVLIWSAFRTFQHMKA